MKECVLAFVQRLIQFICLLFVPLTVKYDPSHLASICLALFLLQSILPFLFSFFHLENSLGLCHMLSLVHFVSVKHFLGFPAGFCFFQPSRKSRAHHVLQMNLKWFSPHLCGCYSHYLHSADTNTQHKGSITSTVLPALCICSLWRTFGVLKVKDHVRTHYRWPTKSDLSQIHIWVWSLFTEFKEGIISCLPWLLYLAFI